MGDCVFLGRTKNLVKREHLLLPVMRTSTYPRNDRNRRSAFAISSSLRSKILVLLSLAAQRSANAAPFVAPKQSLKSMLEDWTTEISLRTW